MAFRKQIEKSQFLAWLLGVIAGGYLSLCNRTTKWEVRGEDTLRSALAEGPVLLVLWHGRLLLVGHHWPRDARQLSTLHDTSPIARVVGALHTRLGLLPMEMSNKRSNIAASRMILRRMKEGACIGLTGDGPTGPAQVVKVAPLDWARITGMPVFAYAFSTKRHKILGSWDRMMLPLPFTRGAKVFAKLSVTIPRKGDSGREEISALMTQVMRDADELAANI